MPPPPTHFHIMDTYTSTKDTLGTDSESVSPTRAQRHQSDWDTARRALVAEMTGNADSSRMLTQLKTLKGIVSAARSDCPSRHFWSVRFGDYDLNKWHDAVAEDLKQLSGAVVRESKAEGTHSFDPRSLYAKLRTPPDQYKEHINGRLTQMEERLRVLLTEVQEFDERQARSKERQAREAEEGSESKGEQGCDAETGTSASDTGAGSFHSETEKPLVSSRYRREGESAQRAVSTTRAPARTNSYTTGVISSSLPEDCHHNSSHDLGQDGDYHGSHGGYHGFCGGNHGYGGYHGSHGGHDGGHSGGDGGGGGGDGGGGGC